MAAFEAVSFAPNGEYLAATSADGRLRIWETATGVLKQEYTPSSHLSAACTCLSWGFDKANAAASARKKKKKRRSEVIASASELNLLAMGTSSGTILLYSISKGDLQSQMADGHSSKVTAVCWATHNSFIYSGAKDQQIIEWDIETGDIKRKWKAEHGKSVNAMCVSEDGQTLITASRKIQWWDLNTLEIMKVFTGHATPVRQVVFASYPNSTETEGRYLLSCAVGDKVIHAWQLNKEKDDKNALAAFSLSEEPVSMDVSVPSSKDETVLLAATTRNGTLHVFEHHLNGRCKKPLRPALTLNVSTAGFEDDGGVAQPLPIATTRFCNDPERSILFTYGSVLQLRFEKIPYSSTQKELCLVRSNPAVVPTSNNLDSLKIKTPSMNSSVKVLGPSNLAVVSSSAPRPWKDEQVNLNVTDLPMEERLNVLTLKQSGSEPPRVTNHAQLLLQALQSNDSATLQQVFATQSDKTVISTVRRIPFQSVVPLIKELQTRILSRASPSLKLLRWVRCLFFEHTSYLMTLPNLDELLGPLHQIFVSRTQMFEKISKLQGRVDLVHAQLGSTRKSETTDDIPDEALLQYQDDSEDEAEEMIYDFPCHSETEEEWNPSETENYDDDDDMEVDGNGRQLRERFNSSDEMSDVE